MRVLRLEWVAVLVLLGSRALAADVTVENAWFRAMPAHLPAAGYFTLRNTGKSQVILTGASAGACGMLMLHKSSSENGMSSMSGMDSIPVPPRHTVSFAPNGYHLMCEDPNSALKHGAKVPVKLQFADGKTLMVNFVVKDARGH